MDIRLAIKNDIPQILKMKKATNSERYLKRIEKAEKKEAHYLVVEDNDKILGHVFLKLTGNTRHPEYPEIEDLFVDNALRGQGIGTKLLIECESLAMKECFEKIGLSVNPENNPRAVDLYEKMGFYQIKDSLFIDGVYEGVEDWCVDMVKKLD